MLDGTMSNVVFIVNGGFESAIGYRARAFAGYLQERFAIQIRYRSRGRLMSLVLFTSSLVRLRPAVSYVFDMAYSGVLAAIIYKVVARNRLIVETGDAIYALSRSLDRGMVGRSFTWLLERVSLLAADAIVVRGTLHQKWLAAQGVAATVIPDGVDTGTFALRPGRELRKELNLDGVMTVGLVGSIVWSQRLQRCYGWELVEVLKLLRSESLVGVIIGDGSGVSRLMERCKAYGIEDKVRFVGRVRYEELPSYLSTLDICLSTQTNDVVGNVRTTGKLPLYLATGRYVLASKVGEAGLVLNDDMLVEYDGVTDEKYPHKLAERIAALMREPAKLKMGLKNVELARARFEYRILAERMGDLIDGQVSSVSHGKHEPRF